MKQKYPLSLFLTGFVINLLTKGIFFLPPGVILLIVGVWVPVCRYLGVAFLVLPVILAFVAQWRMRGVTLQSDDPGFADFQNAVLSPDWRKNITDLIEDSMEQGEVTDEDSEEDSSEE